MPAVTGNIPADPSPPLQAVLWWLESLTSMEFEQLSLAMTDDYTHTILPHSLAQGGLKSKEEIINRWKTNTQTFRDFSGIVHDIVEWSNKIVIRATSRANTSRGPYENEYVFIFDLRDVDGCWKISACREFLDSKCTDEFWGYSSNGGAKA